MTNDAVTRELSVARVESRVIGVDSGVSDATAVSRPCYSDPMGKRREPDIFDDNPLTEDLLEWMVSPDGQAAGEVSGLVFATLENASVDAKRRKIIWADGERLSIEQSAERIHAEHPDRPRELIEISLCSWFEHRVPESGSERQINELDRLFGPWIRDRERKSRAGKE